MPRGRKRAAKKDDEGPLDVDPPVITLADILPPTGKGKRKTGLSLQPAVTAMAAPSPPVSAEPKPRGIGRGGGRGKKVSGKPVKQTEAIKEKSDLPLISSIGGGGGRRDRRSYSVAFASDVGMADEECEGQCACESPNREMGTQADHLITSSNREMGTQADLLITSSKELLDKYVQEYDGKSPTGAFPNNRYAQLVGPIVLSSDMEDDEDDKLQSHLLPSLDEHEMSFLQDLSKSRSLDPHDLL